MPDEKSTGRNEAAALIIAAGRTASTQAFEPMRSTGVLTAVQRLILTFRQAGVRQIVLVAHDKAEKLDKHVAQMQVVLLRAEHEEMQMLDAVKQGLAYLQGRCTAALITPVDVPLFTAETVRALLATKAGVASPSYEGRAGHPLWLKAQYFAAIQDYSGQSGLRGALQTLPEERTYIQVEDEGTVLNARAAKDVEGAAQVHSLRRLHPRLWVQLAKEEVFFDPGVEHLLRLVDNTGSVRLACRLMGVSYSKGWKIINLLEEQMGEEIVYRQQGGPKGGAARLTKQGAELLQSYRAFAAACEEKAQQLFSKYFTEANGLV